MAIKEFSLGNSKVRVEPRWDNEDGRQWYFICLFEDPAIEDVYDAIRWSEVSAEDVRDAIDYLNSRGSNIVDYSSIEVLAITTWACEQAIHSYPKVDAADHYFGL